MFSPVTIIPFLHGGNADEQHCKLSKEVERMGGNDGETYTPPKR